MGAICRFVAATLYRSSSSVNLYTLSRLVCTLLCTYPRVYICVCIYIYFLFSRGGLRVAARGATSSHLLTRPPNYLPLRPEITLLRATFARGSPSRPDSSALTTYSLAIFRVAVPTSPAPVENYASREHQQCSVKRLSPPLSFCFSLYRTVY